MDYLHRMVLWEDSPYTPVLFMKTSAMLVVGKLAIRSNTGRG